MIGSPTGQTMMSAISHGHVTRCIWTINQAVHAWTRSTNSTLSTRVCVRPPGSEYRQSFTACNNADNYYYEVIAMTNYEMCPDIFSKWPYKIKNARTQWPEQLLNIISTSAEAPYHPATNGVAECLVQTFKKSPRKLNLPLKEALQEFLMQYWRTLLLSGYSRSELLNGRQIHIKLDALVLFWLTWQRVLKLQESYSVSKEQKVVSRFPHQYKVEAPCYALYHRPRRDKDPRWAPAIVIKVNGPRSVHVRVCPRGPVWRKHIEQLRPRYGVKEDLDPEQASKLMVPQDNLASGKTPKEWGDSQVEEPEPWTDLESGYTSTRYRWTQ